VVSALAELRTRTWLVVGALALLLALAPTATARSAQPVGMVTGTVTGNGAPVASALVTLTPVDRLGSATERAQRTFTDSQGVYAFRDLPAGWVKVAVRAPLGGDLVDTYWPQVHTFDDAGVLEITTGTTTADLDLPTGGSASGRVVEARTGAPVLGARVTATIVGDRASGRVGTIGPVGGPGQFSLTGLPPVPVELSVDLPPGSPFLPPVPGRPGADDSLRLDGGASTTDLTIGVRRSATISGTVLDDAGAPVVGADVRLVGCLPVCPRHGTSDTLGRYRLEAVAPGRGLAVVAQPAWGLLGPWYPSREATARVGDLEVEEGDVLESVDLALTRPAFVTLDVLGAGRVPPLPAIVRLTTAGRTFSQYFASPAVVAADPPAPDQPGAVPLRLNVGPVPAGEYSVSITMGVADIGYLPTRWVSDSGTLTTPTIRLGPGEQNSSVIRLTPPGGPPDVGAGVPGSPTPGDWPGLTRGFLDPRPWTDVSG
jgi:hypothetical protein